MTSPPVSQQLLDFTNECVYDRAPILRFVESAAASLAPGARVLDAGSGRAPYRELFTSATYVTADWPNSPHGEAKEADLVCSLDAIPAGDSSFEAVLCTQVLEHVPKPRDVLRELHRVLVPGGKLWMTVPFVGELHEEPYDFFRYTSFGARAILEDTGFEVLSVSPLSGYFTSIAALLRQFPRATGVRKELRQAHRVALAVVVLGLAGLIRRMDRLDHGGLLPIGYSCVAQRPLSG
jgi:SAM-dependent methyltransferase